MNSKKTGKTPDVKVPTTPKVAAKVQGITAKTGGGMPAKWVGNLQRAANTNFGKSGSN